jgi:hypothetical protein
MLFCHYLPAQTARGYDATVHGLANHGRSRSCKGQEAFKRTLMVNKPSSNSALKVRLNDPAKYSGKRGEDPEQWLFQMEQYHRLAGFSTDLEKCVYAGGRSAGPATPT